MLREIYVDLNNVFLSLSDAIDLANPSIACHQMRCAYIVWQMGKTAKLSRERIKRLYMAALLHDIGAMTPKDKIRLHTFEESDILAHCLRGEVLFESVPLLAPAAPLIRHHHRNWSDCDAPIGDPDVLDAQILHLADWVERLIRRDAFILSQMEVITTQIRSMEHTVFHPDIVELFIRTSDREEFWLDISSTRLYGLLLKNGPLRSIETPFEDIASIARVMQKLIDFRSPFTATHSAGVAECASLLTEHFGYMETEVKLMRLAGHFHDLGKLIIPNAILEKPGKLTREEFQVMKQHTYFTYEVLHSIDRLERVAEWAAFHHEKLDGTGYPFRVGAEKINTGARIMAVADIFTALTEDRPYRPGMPLDKALGILEDQAQSGKIEPRVVSLLGDHAKEISQQVKASQLESMRFYTEHFTDAVLAEHQVA